MKYVLHLIAVCSRPVQKLCDRGTRINPSYSLHRSDDK